MAKVIFTFSLLLIFQLSNAQDFRNVTWGDTQEDVRKKEKLELTSVKGVRSKLEVLSCVEFTEDEVFYTYNYMFYENKLIGIKIKTSYLVKENSRYTISLLYKEATGSYKDKYKDKFKEEQSAKDGLYKLNVYAPTSKIFVEMKQEGGDFYLLESIMKNKGEIAALEEEL
jgi:hypothetical protein